MRKLASIQKVVKVTPIAGADKIELTTVLGWNCITKKGETKEGDLVVYCEIDSILPERPEFEFLRDRKFKIKTWKLNKFGVISQGIIFPLSILPKGYYSEGQDVTEILGVKKFEQEEVITTEFEVKKGRSVFVNYLMRYEWFRKTFMKWFVSGKDNKGFPSFISKTDETRIQNLVTPFENEWKNTDGWSVSEKLDGQSVTYFNVTEKGKIFKKKTFGVCSRNLYLATKYDCSYWQVASREFVREKLETVPFDVAIQGEIIGPKIQGNKYKVTENEFYVFNVKNLNTGKYLSNPEVEEFCNKYGFEHVPYLNHNAVLPETMNELIKSATATSVKYNTLREGLVYRKGNVSFKVISPEFLLKNNE